MSTVKENFRHVGCSLLPYFISEHPGMYVTEKSKMDTAQITLARVQSSESAVQKQLLQETINLHCRKY